MKYLSPTLQTLLATGQFWMADLYTITLISGTVLRYCTADYPITSDGNVFKCAGTTEIDGEDVPAIQRSSIKQSVGISVDDLDLTIYPKVADLVDGVSFLTAIKHGAFDGAELDLDRAFMPTAGDVSAGVVRRFGGRFGPIDADRTSVVATIKAHSELLDVKLPRDLYGPSCPLTLFETKCGVVRASFTFSGTVGTGATLSSIPVLGVSQAAGYFDTGIISFASGTIRRSVKTWSGGTAHLATPLFAIPSAGAALTLTAGCPKTTDGCQVFWGDDYVLHFQGCPFIPEAETVY